MTFKRDIFVTKNLHIVLPQLRHRTRRGYGPLQQTEPCSDPSDATRGTPRALAPKECLQSRGRSSGPSPGLGRGPAVQASRRKRLRPAPSSAPAAGPEGAGRGRAVPAGRAPSAAGAAPPPRPLIGCGPGGGARGSRLAPLSGAFGASAMAESGARGRDGETQGRRGGRSRCPCPPACPRPSQAPRFAVRRGATVLGAGEGERARTGRGSARARRAVGRSQWGRTAWEPRGGLGGAALAAGTSACGRGTGGSARERARAARRRGSPAGRGGSPGSCLRLEHSAQAAAAGAGGPGWGWKHACPRGARCLSRWRTVKAIDRR